MVHGFISPENIMYGPDGQVKIDEFYLSTIYKRYETPEK